jgi:hypothetical protein
MQTRACTQWGSYEYYKTGILKEWVNGKCRTVVLYNLAGNFSGLSLLRKKAKSYHKVLLCFLPVWLEMCLSGQKTQI